MDDILDVAFSGEVIHIRNLFDNGVNTTDLDRNT